MKHKLRIGVLRGGPSNEYEVSLASGTTVLDVLRKNFVDKYDVVDIFIDKKGKWHVNGLEVSPDIALHKFDVAFNALHGNFGEDGQIQHFFETHGKHFTGSPSLASAIGMNKALTKKILKDNGIKTPYWTELNSDLIKDLSEKAIVKEFHESTMLPAVVKPVTSGSSVGVTIVRAYKDMPAALKEAAAHSDSVIIEEFIPGIESTCGVIENFRNHEVYALPPIEIRPRTAFFDYDAKYNGMSDEIVPATFSQKIKSQLADLSQAVHKILGLRHYSRSDFIIHPRRGIYFLEVNTLPGLTGESLIPKALRAVGSDVHEFVDHVIQLSIK